MTDNVYRQVEFENGLKCEHLGIKTEDMNKRQLIAYIGLLDDLYGKKCAEVYSLWLNESN